MRMGHKGPRPHYLTATNWPKAVEMWHQGFDTYRIASHFGVEECVIYNDLHRWRERLRGDGGRQDRIVRGQAAVPDQSPRS